MTHERSPSRNGDERETALNLAREIVQTAKEYPATYTHHAQSAEALTLAKALIAISETKRSCPRCGWPEDE